jgi:hypothetical protein
MIIKLTDEDIAILNTIADDDTAGKQIQIGQFLSEYKAKALKKQILDNQEIVERVKDYNDRVIKKLTTENWNSMEIQEWIKRHFEEL